MGDIVATMIVALVVLWSAYVLLRRFMPKSSFKLQQALATQAGQHGFKKTAQWVAPKNNQSSCGGCSSCGDDAATGCDSTEKVEEKTKPVQWR